MGNCLSCCIVESYEMSENQYLFINKKKSLVIKRRSQNKNNSYYDSCVF